MKKYIFFVSTFLLNITCLFSDDVVVSSDVTMNLEISVDKYAGINSTSTLSWTCTADSKITATNNSAITNAADFTKVNLSAISITNGTAASAVNLKTTNSSTDYVTSISTGEGNCNIKYDVEHFSRTHMHRTIKFRFLLFFIMELFIMPFIFF